MGHILQIHANYPNVKGPSAEVQKYVHTILTNLLKIGVTKYLKANHQEKTVIAGLMAGLPPAGAVNLVFEDRKVWKESERGSMSHFLSRAGKFVEQVQEVGYISNVSSQKVNCARAENGQSKNGRIKTRDKSDMERTRKRHQDEPMERNVKPCLGKHPWTKPCLLPRCTEQHRVEKRPIATSQNK